MKIILILLTTFTCLHAELKTIKKHQDFKCFICQSDRNRMNEKIAVKVEDETSQLAVKLLSSIIHQDKESFVDCFMTKDEVVKFSKKLNLDEEQIKRSLEHQKELEASLEPFFKKALELSKKLNINKETIIKSVEVNVSESSKTEYRVSWMLIEFICNQKSYSIKMDDGFKFGGKWKFTDKAKTNITENGVIG